MEMTLEQAEKDAIKKMVLAGTLADSQYKKPLIICYSGGKDSDVLLDIALKSGINFTVQHSLTTVDAPETMKHIRLVFAKLEKRGIKTEIFRSKVEGKYTTMWNLIERSSMPPTRKVRYCCKYLKEGGGIRHAIATGVRKAESVKRSKRKYAENFSRNFPASIDFEDFSTVFGDTGEVEQFVIHDENFKQSCRLKGKTSFNPLIDWSDNNVKEYIEKYKLEINPLYKQGFCRVGCIGCPLAGAKKQIEEFNLYPQFAAAYFHSFEKMIIANKKKGKVLSWKNGDEVFNWWLDVKNWREVIKVKNCNPIL